MGSEAESGAGAPRGSGACACARALASHAHARMRTLAANCWVNTGHFRCSSDDLGEDRKQGRSHTG